MAADIYYIDIQLRKTVSALFFACGEQLEEVINIWLFIHLYRFHILTPMYVGLTNTINSLYCVKKMVFDRDNITTLEVLRMALMNNWGEKYAMQV